MLFKKSNIIDDKALTKAISEMQKGSAQAFHLLYQKYNQSIFRYCLKMLNDKDTADDAFQETFIKVYEHRLEFKGTNFQSWVYTIAHRTCLNYIRNKKDSITFEEEYQAPVFESEEDIGAKQFIEKAVAALPLSLRETLVLREYEECSYQEIAEILDIDISLAKVRVHRARLILRQMLQPLVKEIYESR
jgi:RNA polymerase sigma-70 factor (ECF subfamily)